MLRKILSFVTICALILGVSVNSLVYAEDESIIVNGDFESGEYTAWSYYNTTGNVPQIVSDTEFVHNGNYGVKVVGELKQDNLPLEKNTYYIFKGFEKATEDNTLICFCLRDEGNSLYYMDYNDKFNIGDWTETTKIFKTEENMSDNVSFKYVSYMDNGAFGEIAVDDVEIQKLILSGTVGGKENIEFNEYGATSKYTVQKIHDNFNAENNITGYDVAWSLKDGYPEGVSINSQTGILSVSGDCEDGAVATVVADITAKVSVCTGNTNSYSEHEISLQSEKNVTLKKSDLPGPPPEDPEESSFVNLLNNGDLETNSLQPWSVGSKTSISEDSSKGNYCVYSKDGSEVAQKINVKPNTYYFVYSDMRAENNDTLLYMNVWDDTMENKNSTNPGNWILDYYYKSNSNVWNTLGKIIKTGPVGLQ